jgi:hypothetical protein
MDPRFEKFFKMKKMLPEGAVRQKMMAEGFSDSEIDDFFAGKIGMIAAPAGAPAVGGGDGGAAAAAAAAEEDARRQEEVKRARERKAREDKAAKEAEAKRLAELEKMPPEGFVAKPKITPNSKMKNIFWTKLKRAQVPTTIWKEVEEKSLKMAYTNLIDELLGDKKAEAKVEEEVPEENKKKEKAKAVSLLDGKKTQNISIFLSKYRLSPEQAAKLVIELKTNELTHSLTESIIGICPNEEEIGSCKAFDKPQLLDPASKLAREFGQIPRVQQRLHNHEVAFRWENDASEAATSLQCYRNACTELKTSQRTIGKLFGILLGFGNYINGGGTRGQAYGVKLDLLGKLAITKLNQNTKGATENHIGGTLMHLLAWFIEKETPELLGIAEGWDAVMLTAERSFRQLQTDVGQLTAQINKVE